MEKATKKVRLFPSTLEEMNLRRKEENKSHAELLAQKFKPKRRTQILLRDVV